MSNASAEFDPNEYGNESDCDNIYRPQPYLNEKFVIIGIVGSAVAVASMIENVLLLLLFVKTPKLYRRGNRSFLALLALFDLIVAFSYVLVLSAHTFAEYYRILPLYLIWHQYFPSVFTISHACMSSSTYVLLTATLERFLASQIGSETSRNLLRLLRRKRPFAMFLSVFFGTALKVSVFFELRLVYNDDCEDFASVHLVYADVPDWYISLWRFWGRRILTVFIPFFMLAFLNAAIVLSLRRQTRDHTVKTLILYVTVGSRATPDLKRSDVKAATRALIMVVTCYLIANVLDVILASWEYIDSENLAENFPMFYAIGSDIASMLTVFTTALRLPIYILNDRRIRMAFKHTFSLSPKRLSYIKSSRLSVDSMSKELRNIRRRPTIDKNSLGAFVLNFGDSSNSKEWSNSNDRSLLLTSPTNPIEQIPRHRNPDFASFFINEMEVISSWQSRV